MVSRLPPPGRLPCGPDGRPPEEIVIRFVCVNPAHVASTVPGKVGSLVTHSGTCGYCPGQSPHGAHTWENNRRVSLAELLTRGERPASPRPRRASAPRPAPRAVTTRPKPVGY